MPDAFRLPFLVAAPSLPAPLPAAPPAAEAADAEEPLAPPPPPPEPPAAPGAPGAPGRPGAPGGPLIIRGSGRSSIRLRGRTGLGGEGESKNRARLLFTGGVGDLLQPPGIGSSSGGSGP